MTLEIAIVLGLLASAIVLFATEKLTVDLVTLLMLCGLGATRILTPAEAFAGFSSDLLIILGSIFVLGGALQRSGVLESLAEWMLRLAHAGPRRLTTFVMSFAGLLSAFMNNTTVAAMFVPAVSSLARRAELSPSKLLMPLAFAAIMGGTCTLIGTSTNIAVSGYLARSGITPIGLFELAPIGLVILGTGILFMVFLGSRMLPDHEGEAVVDEVGMRDHLAEVVVLPGSPLVGNQSLDWDLSLVGFRLVEMVRHGELLLPGPDVSIAAGDILVVEGNVANLRKVLKIEGIRFKSRTEPGEDEGESPLATGDAEFSIAETIILPGSELCGGTLGEVQFRQRYGLSVLALNRSGHRIVKDLAHTLLREGDVLLVHGSVERIDALLRPGSRVRQLGDPVGQSTEHSGSRRQGITTVTIFLVALVCAGTGLLPMAIAFLGAAVLVILCGCISIEKAYEFIDWRLLILVGGMTAFGTAMQKTGAADLLASGILAGLSPLGITAVLAGFFVLTIALTQPMSNAAAALVVLPIAISAAESLGANPRTFGIAIMLAASISFITPLEPACVLVYGAGKYRFRDFIKVGGLLTILLTIVVLFLIPIFWDL